MHANISAQNMGGPVVLEGSGKTKKLKNYNAKENEASVAWGASVWTVTGAQGRGSKVKGV